LLAAADEHGRPRGNPHLRWPRKAAFFDWARNGTLIIQKEGVRRGSRLVYSSVIACIYHFWAGELPILCVLLGNSRFNNQITIVS